MSLSSTEIMALSTIETLQQENEKLKADVARLREVINKLEYNEFGAKRFPSEEDVNTALSATASSDAWLKERDAKVRKQRSAMVTKA